MVVFIIIVNIITSLLSSCVSFHSSHDDDDDDDHDHDYDDHHVQLFVLNRCCDDDEQLIGLLKNVRNMFFSMSYMGCHPKPIDEVHDFSVAKNHQPGDV